MRGSILIIDDEEKLRKLLSEFLSLEGYKMFQSPNAKAGLKALEREEIHLVICDVKLPDANGVDLIPKIKEISPASEIVLLTAYGTINDSVKAIKLGAFDYITKGDDNDKIIPLVSRAMDKALLQFKVYSFENRIEEKYGFDQIIGSSKAIFDAVELAKKVAPTDASVLLLGETGTGKEVFAQAIHYASLRKHKPFVAINCSAFGKDILESEVFGHKAGAFTGALKDKKGLFETANGGAIFLDEIGEMNIDLQAKLLRFLETGSFIKVGDVESTKVNVRIIAATNRNLLEESEKGNFRADLYYRLSTFQISLPALRERKSDVIPLADHFIRVYSDKVNKRVRGMEDVFKERLKNYIWKGNIRELKNVIERALILATSEFLTDDLLPFEIQHYSQAGENSNELQFIEKKHIQKILLLSKGNKTEAARILNISIPTLYRKIEEYGLSEKM